MLITWTPQQYGIPQPSSLLGADTKLHVLGDSMTFNGASGKWDAGYSQHLTYFTDGIYIFPPTAGSGTAGATGGNLSRSGTEPSDWVASLAEIVSSVGDGVLIIGGIQNSANTAAQDWANFETILSACSAAARIYVVPAAPTMASFTKAPKNDDFNTLASAFCNATPNCTFLSDAWTSPNLVALALDASTPGPDSYDGTHQNAVGSRKQAENMWLQMSADWTDEDAFTNYDLGDNLFAASYAMPGNTAGRADGVTIVDGSVGAILIPTKDTITYEGVAYTAQALTISGIATATGNCSIRRNGFATDFDALDIFDLIFLVEISNAAGNGPPVGLRTVAAATYFNRIIWGGTSVTVGGDLASAFQVGPHLVRVEQYAATEPSAGGTSLNFDFAFTLNTGVAADAKIKVARLACFNRTALGL